MALWIPLTHKSMEWSSDCTLLMTSLTRVLLLICTIIDWDFDTALRFSGDFVCSDYPKDLSEAKFVFARHDTKRKPLQAPYDEAFG